MKQALALCSLALNPLAPSPTASMVKIEGGHMTSFGGTACVRVPVGVEVGACFSPSLFATFFRKEREAVSYTLSKGKLVLKEGKEKLSIPFLPADEMPTLDVLSPPIACELNLEHLKLCADVVDPTYHKPECQGVNFRFGVMEASDGRVLVSATSGLDDDMWFNLPLVSAKILLKLKSKVVSVALEKAAVKFNCADGTSVCSVLIYEQLTDTSPFYKHEWIKAGIKQSFAADVAKIECESFAFTEGGVKYVQEKSEGFIEDVCDKSCKMRISKTCLGVLLKVGNDIRVSATGSLAMSVSEDLRAVSVLYSS